MDWLGEEIRTLRALIDRIIPRDDFPAASGNGVDLYILRLLETDLEGEKFSCSRRACSPFPQDNPASKLAGYTKRRDPLADHPNDIRQGLALLNDEANARFNLPFSELGEDLQDELLKTIENPDHALARFFELIISLTHEGYYTDPSNGSNVDGISWTMIGYDPRLPPAPVAERWTELIQ